jgi:hypothetical protein
MKDKMIFQGSVAPKSFLLRESVLDKSKVRSGRLQNSPSAQTLVIAYPALRQDFFAKTLSMAAQIDIFGATEIRYGVQ